MVPPSSVSMTSPGPEAIDADADGDADEAADAAVNDADVELEAGRALCSCSCTLASVVAGLFSIGGPFGLVISSVAAADGSSETGDVSGDSARAEVCARPARTGGDGGRGLNGSGVPLDGSGMGTAETEMVSRRPTNKDGAQLTLEKRVAGCSGRYGFSAS